LIESQLEFPIRFYDVDMAGIVSNIVYIRWLEDLRMELLRQHFPAREMLAKNLMPVVARTEIDYRASLRFLDECTGQMQVTELGRTSATMYASFRRHDRLVVAEAKQITVFVSTTDGKPALLPEEVRALFSRREGDTQMSDDKQ
jgi:acyl-CoA thioester hydrolase